MNPWVAAMVIHDDPGGRIPDYARDVAAAHNVVINGPCASACTLFLAHPKVCATKKAKLYFHRPFRTNPDGSKRFSPAYDEEYLSQLPVKVRVYVEKRGLSEDGWWVYSAQAIAWVGECRPGWEVQPSNTDGALY